MPEKSLNKSKRPKKQPHMPLLYRLIRLIFSRVGPLFPNYFGNLAYDLWFSTQRFKTPAKELPSKESATIANLDVHGLPVTMYQWGNLDAPKVLFIHGWSGRGTQCAFFIEPLLQAGFQIISFDGPAHGETPGKQTSVLQFADAILQIDKHYGPFDAAITHSFGGMLLAYAMTIGIKIKRTVCICPPDSFDTIFNGFQRTLNLPDSVMNVVNTKFYATHGYKLRNDVSTVTTAKQLSNQALIIHDENDTDVGVSCGKKVADAWPNSKFIMTKGLGHRRIIRDANVIQTAIDFISSP